MIKYIFKCLLKAIPVFIIMTFALFILSDMMPGSPIDVIMAESNLTPEAQAALEHQLGLDKPTVVRYVDWLLDMLTGDMGTSTRTKQSVWGMISTRIGPTLLLTLSGMGIAALISIPLGVLSRLQALFDHRQFFLPALFYRRLGTWLLRGPERRLYLLRQAWDTARPGHVLRWDNHHSARSSAASGATRLRHRNAKYRQPAQADPRRCAGGPQ